MFDVLTINLAVEIFGLFFCLICIIISVFSPQIDCTAGRTAHNIHMLFLSDALMMCFDAIAGLYQGRQGHSADMIANTATFLMFVFSLFLLPLMTKYMVQILNAQTDKRPIRIAWIVFAGNILLLLWNLYSHKVYWLDGENYYHRGPLFSLTQFSGLLIVAVNAVYFLRHQKNMPKRSVGVFASYSILITTALILQIRFYGISFLNIAILLSLIVGFTVNQMEIAQSLAEEQKKVAEQALVLEKSRMQLMVSQIKPHFIFNTLTSIAQLCEDSPSTAKDTTLAFAAYLRGNIRSFDRTEPVSFTDELEYITNYLKIEQVRFGELLSVDYQIQTTNFKIPLLTVQPLVENAVKHGIGMKTDGGTVTIRTIESDSFFQIEVEDDGVGFDVNTISTEKSIGISNIRNRLILLENAELRIESTVGIGTKAVITIPKT